MRVGISAGRLKNPSNLGNQVVFSIPGGVKTRSVARLKQEMIWQQFLIFLKSFHLHWREASPQLPSRSFASDKMHPSEAMWNAVVKRIMNGREYCRGRHRQEETPKLCSGYGKCFPFRVAPTLGGLRSAQDLLSREYPASA